jgi:pimeloyl-ACP methyl ester carboxylesterase
MILDQTSLPPVSHLACAEGRIGYDVAGRGPLVLLIPGMGDLRSAYRLMAPVLRAAGYRVACTDLRGHGDSDATFTSYGDAETASDVIALIEALEGPAVIVGNSMGAGAAALVAADRPDLVTGLVLIGPFVRNASIGLAKRLMFRAVMARPWAAAMWKSYLPKLYAGHRPDDFEEHRACVIESLRRPGYTKAFSLTTRTDHSVAEHRLADVHTPTIVVMGVDDPDFEDPHAEATWIAERLNADVVMVAESAHYPQSQQPDVTNSAVLRFLTKATDRA